MSAEVEGQRRAEHDLFAGRQIHRRGRLDGAQGRFACLADPRAAQHRQRADHDAQTDQRQRGESQAAQPARRVCAS